MNNKEKLILIGKCKTVGEIIELAKKNGYTLNKEEAKELFNKTHSEGQLSETELNNVNGGACVSKEATIQTNKPDTYELINFESEGSVVFIFNVGDHITYCDFRGYNYYIFDAVVVSKRAMTSTKNCKKVWHDCYNIEYTENTYTHSEYNVRRDAIEKK